MRILCFGDSNTYGYDPQSFFGGRYPADSRWVDILAQQTGWELLNFGQNGRSIPYSQAETALLKREISAHTPLDIITVMLGTNDLLLGASAAAASTQMAALLRHIQPLCRTTLLIAPPAMQYGDWVTEENIPAESTRLAAAYRQLAADTGIAFADAGEWHIGLTFDGVHFSAAGHRKFADALHRHLLLIQSSL